MLVAARGSYVTLGDRGDGVSDSGTEVAERDVAAGKIIGDLLAGFFRATRRDFFASVESAEIWMRGAHGHATVVGACESEGTRAGTVQGMGGGHETLLKFEVREGLFRRSRGRER
jgi:hypothetical protein